MKRIGVVIMALMLVALVAEPANAQTFTATPTTRVIAFTVERDTLLASDSTLFMFTAPFNMIAKTLHVECFNADTGAASPAGVFTLVRNGRTTALLTTTVTATQTLAYSTVASVALTAGVNYKIKATLGTSDKLILTKVILWCIY